jgi:SOS-response transcriptional repressor LexA
MIQPIGVQQSQEGGLMPEVAVRRQLDALIRQSGAGYAEISRLIGRNAAYVQQFIKRGVPRRLGETERRLLAAHFGVAEALLGGPAEASLSPQPARHRVHDVPFLEPFRSGFGGSLTVDTAFLSQISPGRSRSLAAFIVYGDAMATTLLPGDHVLVDQSDAAPPRDGLYVIAGEGEPVVKRLSVNPVTRRISVLSDNAAYPSFPDCRPQDLGIVGRVVWIGRALD